MVKKYNISFGIYDIEAQDWITEDEEDTVDFTGHIRDFDGLSSKIIQMIEKYKENKAEEEKEDLEDSEEIKETEN